MSMAAKSSGEDVLQRLQALAEHFRTSNSSQSPTLPPPDPAAARLTNRAAVLICLFLSDIGELRVILTKRASTLSSHSGEVALPGGKRDLSDADDVATALREAEEEIGLAPSLVNVVAVLEPFVNKKGMTVVPVLGLLSRKEAFKPTPSAAEVDAIFDAPLEMFLKDEKRRAVEKEWMGYNYLLHFFEYEYENENYVIWALTAGILIKAASLVFQRPPAFLERPPRFWTASANGSQT
ncbi:nudix hydrolase 11-like isoform X1 [Cucurbita pepo subsp. pepo]|uniref:nudix hydrolase 11-like isoform X1 n=1 Tax=Cucurbita pepo subsp. pepo TaxID=3664 RepID=UPI000C9D72F4|nr:nudix hydrolase 11-like isoform X1 [Cucurbita pepo subsp. pepo]XP_023519155.1 nudix hydrolase 11-like isoform X1 [Cucurbita pepo subsp. pepo]